MSPPIIIWLIACCNFSLLVFSRVFMSLTGTSSGPVTVPAGTLLPALSHSLVATSIVTLVYSSCTVLLSVLSTVPLCLNCEKASQIARLIYSRASSPSTFLPSCLVGKCWQPSFFHLCNLYVNPKPF
uniref:Uncharacterized protein n=1 Tax=Ixodes ricinus TaxID=34613 RepID=A0A6B0UPX7_IXORI